MFLATVSILWPRRTPSASGFFIATAGRNQTKGSMLDLLTMPETAAALIAAVGAIVFVVARRSRGRD